MKYEMKAETLEAIIQKQDELIELLYNHVPYAVRGSCEYVKLYKEIRTLKEGLQGEEKLNLIVPTDKEIEYEFTTPHFDNKNGHHYRVKKDRIFGAKWAIEQIIELNR
jgi:hypothetical protein